jgi:hypothetical protein
MGIEMTIRKAFENEAGQHGRSERGAKEESMNELRAEMQAILDEMNRSSV